MSKEERYRNRIELLQFTLDLLVLQTLRWGPQHGYGLSQLIRVNFYRLTPAGRKQLVEERSRWEQMSEAIAGVLNPPDMEPQS